MHPWRVRLERILGPVARRSALSPNTISSIALALNLIAATCLWLASGDARFYLLVPVIVFFSGLLDGLDGLVARFQGKTSTLGDFLDHLFDRISDSTLIAGWVLGAGVRPSLAVAAVLIVSLTGYVGTQLEASYHVRDYKGVGRGEFMLAIFVVPLIAWILHSADLLDRNVGYFSSAEWITLVLMIFSSYAFVSRVIDAFRLANREKQDDGNA